jgi:hypothetical protein
LTSHFGGSFGFLAARLRSRRAEFPLYHTPHHLSRGNLHKFLFLKNPDFVHFDYCNLAENQYNNKCQGETMVRPLEKGTLKNE